MLRVAMVPSRSVAEKVAVTNVPVGVGEGSTDVTATVGGLSVIVTVVVPEPVEPLLSVAVTVMVKTLLRTLPTEA